MDYDPFDGYDEYGVYDDVGVINLCHRCGKAIKKNPTYCNNCHDAVYCSSKCMKDDKKSHMSTCGIGGGGMFGGGMQGGRSSNNKSTGYGGDKGDQRKRTAGKKQAMKRETKAWKDWNAQLKTFLKQKKQGNDDVSSEILNTLKQVLRCQAPEWWWKQPQRSLYITALRVCVVLTKAYPKAWGDPEDEQSAIAALEQLSQTSSLLVKQLGKENPDKDSTTTTDATTWISQQLKTPCRNANEKDSSIPIGVLKIRDEAVAVIKTVIEAPECSMVDSTEFYRQKLRPLAFQTVESFDNPQHFYSAGGGHERSPYGGAGYMSFSYGKKTKATSKKPSDSGIKSSAAVLWKELSTYPTALPIEYGSSIFVRASENELDKLRVLIIGPEDTPYANGCFVFDLSLGNDYPNAPPKVQFLTTSSFMSPANTLANKNIRFNPNLYECGKVCLSLLGTWSGPSWSPGESTLLQVLVSLQSLVFGTADPYFNEPGFAGSEGTSCGKQASERYNRNIRMHTLRVAILPFLQNQLPESTSAASNSSKRKNSPHQEIVSNRHFPEFEEVIENHFKLKKQNIRKQLFDWLQEDKEAPNTLRNQRVVSYNARRSVDSFQALYETYWDVSDQLDRAARATMAGASAGSRRRQKRTKIDTAAIRMKDGVILLDDDDDDKANLQQALSNSMATLGNAPAATASKPEQSGDGVILLDGNDDDMMNRKPAAKTSLDAAGNAKEGKMNETVRASPSKGSESANDEVVDLT